MAKIFREATVRPVFSKRHIVVGLTATIILVSAVVAFLAISKQITQQSSMAFTIDGKVYSKDEINTLIKFPVSRGISANDAAKRAFTYYKRKAAAQKVGMTLQKDVTAKIKATNFPEIDADSPWAILVSEDMALENQLKSTKTFTNAKGYYFILPFSDRIQAGEDVPANAPKDVGDAAAIAQDRAYAQEQATTYHDGLVSGKLKSEDVLKEIKTNAELGYFGVVGSNTSMRFEGLGNPVQNSPEIYILDTQKQYIFALASKVGVGDVKVGTISALNTAGKNVPVEAYYYFATIDSSASVQSAGAFETALKKITASYGGI